MREGAVLRDTVFEDSQGRRTRLQTVHFASSADQHLCCLQARITPENHAALVSVHSGIDGTGYNLDRRPIYTEPPPDHPQTRWHKWAKSKHLEEVAREQLPDGIYLETRTVDTGITIGYVARTTVSAAVKPDVEQHYKYIEQVSRTQVAAQLKRSPSRSWSSSTRPATSPRPLSARPAWTRPAAMPRPDFRRAAGGTAWHGRQSGPV